MSLDSMKKIETKRRLTLAMGLLTAITVVVTQLFFFQVQESDYNKEVAATQQEDSSTSSEEAYFTLPSSTLPSSNHVEVHQETFLLIEILFGEEDSSVNFELVTKPVSQWLFTLFRTAISPNAP